MSTNYRLNTVRRWIKECKRKNKKWAKSEINAVVKCLQGRNFRCDKADLEMNNTFDELQQLSGYGSFEHTITREQSLLGINYIKRRYFKLNDEPRKSCPFGDLEQSIIHNFKKFTFVGYYAHYNQYGSNFVQYTPVYRVYDHAGNYFDYSPIHWGTPIIVHIQRKEAA